MSNNPPGCLGRILQLFGIMPEVGEGEPEFPYKVKKKFLSESENSLYKTLTQWKEGQVLVFPKVSLGEILFVNLNDRSSRTKYYNKIDRKNIDFLICDINTMKPVCGVDLEGSRNKQMEEFVKKVFESAGLNYIKFEQKKRYDLNEVKEKLEPALVESSYAKTNTTNTLNTKKQERVESKLENNPPICKKCGTTMVLRKAKKGDMKGEEFYGCPNFPDCKEIVRK